MFPLLLFPRDTVKVSKSRPISCSVSSLLRSLVIVASLYLWISICDLYPIYCGFTLLFRRLLCYFSSFQSGSVDLFLGEVCWTKKPRPRTFELVTPKIPVPSSWVHLKICSKNIASLKEHFSNLQLGLFRVPQIIGCVQKLMWAKLALHPAAHEDDGNDTTAY